jgi:hypothetical protein
MTQQRKSEECVDFGNSSHQKEFPEPSDLCRICHQRNPSSDLVAPCLCHGSISWIHKKCLEHWLTQSETEHCELCGTQFECIKEPASLGSWLSKYPRHLLTDIALGMFMTPLAVLCVFLCFYGAVIQAQVDNLVQSLCLFSLGSFLVGVFIAWIALSTRNHISSFRDYQDNHQVVKVILGHKHRRIEPSGEVNVRSSSDLLTSEDMLLTDICLQS